MAQSSHSRVFFGGDLLCGVRGCPDAPPVGCKLVNDALIRYNFDERYRVFIVLPNHHDRQLDLDLAPGIRDGKRLTSIGA